MNNFTLLLVLALGFAGWFIYDTNRTTPAIDILKEPPPLPIEREVAFDISTLDAEIAAATTRAENAAIVYAKNELDKWHDEIMIHVDTHYLDWHFNYSRNITNKVTNFARGFFTDEEKIAREEQEEIAKAFSTRVMPPRIIEEDLRDIAERSMNVFFTELKSEIDQIPTRYNLPPTRWQEYLRNITVITSSIEGQTSESLTLKSMMVGGGLAATAISAGAMELALPLIDSALSVAGMELGLSASFMEGASFGGMWTLAIAGAIIGAWEFFDHKNTVAQNKPLLRAHIDKYLRQFEANQLSTTGIIGMPIYTMKTSIARSST